MSEPRAVSAPRPLDRFLAWWVQTVQSHTRLTLAVIAALTLVLGQYAATHIAFNADPNSFFSKELRFQKAILEFERYFPNLTNSLLVVVDAETPEQTRAAAELLLDDLDSQRGVFYRAFQPGEDRFFERYGLLYAAVDELDDFADHMALIQPVLGELARDLSLPSLTRVLKKGLEQEDAASRGADGWQAVLEHLWGAADSVRLGDDSALSWESVLLEGSGLEPTTRSVLVADPILDLDRVLAAERSIDAVRATALRLGLTPENGVTVRVSGYPAINYEEMIGLSKDTGAAGALSFVLVVLLLTRAFRSKRLVSIAALTLVVGLVWAAAFAAATVGELSPMSITFGVLVIGLGIDFMIHLGMHFVDRVVEGLGAQEAVQLAVADTGSALVLCAATTGAGFLAFVPTEFIAISDLGIAAVGGMTVILILTLTLMPPLIDLVMTPAACQKLAARGPARGIWLPRPTHPRAVIALAAVLGLASLPLLPLVDLDTNVISMRNPHTESVQTFRDLLAVRETTPWYLDAFVPSLDRALELADRMRGLPEVDEVVTIADFVPEEQEEKVEILADVSMMLGLPRSITRSQASPQAQLAALRELRDFLATEPSGPDTELAPSIARLHQALFEFIAVAEKEKDGHSVALLSDLLLDPLPDQIQRLNASLEVAPIARADLPSTLITRMLATDGHARIQVYPSGDLWSHEVMVKFVESIRPIWVDITGLPVNLVESARTTWRSLRTALIGSTLAITLLLLVLWRSPSKAVMVLAPLLLAVLLTQVGTVLLPVSFNFANVIVLPLLIGIGVDSGIHLVQRADELKGDSVALLESTTARAVTFSAFTTVASFGALMIAGHRGAQSLGALLVIGMVWTLAANLVLLPAILSLRQRRR